MKLNLDFVALILGRNVVYGSTDVVDVVALGFPAVSRKNSGIVL